MHAANSDREGRLSTPPAAAGAFLEEVYDRDSRTLRIDRMSPFWEGVRVAHEQGRIGTGKRVAILDAEFDLGYDGLASAASPDSRILPLGETRHARHGTSVALLVHEVAPAATLQLIDIWPGIHLEPQTVAAAVDAALVAGADVINLSLEFASDCEPADHSGFNVDVLASEDPPREKFVDQVRYWLTANEPYRAGGCSSCPLCAALRRVPETVLVICAAGNTDRRVCPACFTRCVGVGFERWGHTLMEGRDVTSSWLPDFRQNPRAELVLAQPPGFEGTSFAAPLLSGLGAVLLDPSDIVVMGRMPFAIFPLSNLLSMLSANWPPTKTAIATLVAGFEVFGQSCPIAHRHWEGPEPRACPTCSVFMIDWYMNYVSLMIWIGDPRMLKLAGAAARVAPYSPDAALNHGTALARLAMAQPEGSEDRSVNLRLAAAEYRRSLDLLPGSNAASVELARVNRELARLTN